MVHLANLNKNISEFEKRKVELITIAVDSAHHLRTCYEENGFNFIMIADRGAKIAKNYEVSIAWSKMNAKDLRSRIAIPSTFLIDKNFKIKWKSISAHAERPSIPLLTEIIDSMIQDSNQNDSYMKK